jgi:MGT family glycosyltransferase
MARILFCTVTAGGHVTPLLPIARALVQRGHEVRWIGGQRQQRRIEATGARFLPYRHARDLDESRLNEELPGRAKLTGLACLKFDIKHIFLDPSLDQLRDIEDAVAEQACDVLVADLAYLGAQLHRERTGTPLVVMNITALLLGSRDLAPAGLGFPPMAGPVGRLRNAALQLAMQRVLMRDVQLHAQALRARIGLAPSGWFMDYHHHASLVLQPSVPSLEYPRTDMPANVHFIGLLPMDADAQVQRPAWFDELDGPRPVVHVTQGTVANQRPDLFRPALEAMAREDVLVVIATGHRPVEALELGLLPENVRIAPFLPYPELMLKTRAMLSNGGYGGVQYALAHGVPVAVAGDTEEKPEIAARVAYSGAGLNLKTGKPSARAVGRAVRRLLDDAKLRGRARELAAEYARYDALTLAVQHIEAVAVR